MTQAIHIVHSSKNYNKSPCVLTIGNFDGVHIGHQREYFKRSQPLQNLAI